ncbi:AraC family transcriptional regulator [Rhodovastum atsumiense]|uniref:AraC family transcriptional regulator n=1 Tax=Rhodovastum atsumiense TaxID=504468 RepID=A0A5M6IPT0_9PROT|nr:helix-turn-helix transcriptional regulator [Rhodovastum atsumiense]KAA5610292.1 AraC family transcriptional regulator [Rhodovastum atsumiense]CAH2602220.1 AraC family transcriptional regulator [Rhodovastum atsumiense]
MTPKSTNREDYQHLPQPVGAMPKEYPAGHVSARHSHQRAQLVHATSGVMEVEADGRRWVIPPGRALWLPPGIAHATRMHGAVSLRTLYIRPGHEPEGAPAGLGFVRVSPLLRELVERACALPVAYEGSTRARRTVELMLQEFEWTREPGLPRLRAADPRLQRILRGMQADPACQRSLDEWAALAGISPRSVARLCRCDLGMTFAQVRQHLRLRAALPRILAGEAVTTVALDVGYETPAAFSTLFRRVLGVPPSKYLQG